MRRKEKQDHPGPHWIVLVATCCLALTGALLYAHLCRDDDGHETSATESVDTLQTLDDPIRVIASVTGDDCSSEPKDDDDYTQCFEPSWGIYGVGIGERGASIIRIAAIDKMNEPSYIVYSEGDETWAITCSAGTPKSTGLVDGGKAAAGIACQKIANTIHGATMQFIDETNSVDTFWKRGETGSDGAVLREFGDGDYLVNDDIEPGTYTSSIGGPLCYWARVVGEGKTLGDIIESDVSLNPATVTISADDTGFKTTNCGTWKKKN